MTDIARKELRSYKQLPQIWYQIQTKFRDEPRPKSGLLRVRQFIMKDAYSFDIDAAGLDVSYKKHYDAYCRIFDRCGLKYMVVEADSGAMGGSQSHEFMVRTPAGEDLIVSCDKCNYAANLEKATSKLAPVEDLEAEGDGKPARSAHSGDEDHRGCSEVPRCFTQEQDEDAGADGRSPMPKTGKASARAVVLLMRGDHQMNEAKLSAALAGKETRPMQEEEIRQTFNSPAGFLGPIGIAWAKDMNDVQRPVLLVDKALEGRSNLIGGANKEDYHLKNITPGRDFQPTAYADLRSVTAGRRLPQLRRDPAH